MIVKIIQGVSVLIFLSTIVMITIRFIRESIQYRRHMKKLKQWSDFNNQLMEWSKEIVDVEVRVNFINQCAHELMHFANDKVKNGSLDDWDIESEKIKIYNDWGKHIPSLLQEVRNNKLSRLKI